MVTPSILSTDVERAVQGVLSVPGFGEQDENIRIMVSLYVQYAAAVESAQSDAAKLELSQNAIDELEIVAPCDRVGLRRILNQLAMTRRSVASDLDAEWETLTGAKIGQDLNITGRLEGELDEQQPLKLWALRLETKVRDIDVALALNALSPISPEEEEAQENPKGLLEGLQNLIARRLVEQRQREIEEQGLDDTAVEPGWLTDSVLDENDKNLMLAEKRLDFVLAKIAGYQGDEKTRPQTAKLVTGELNNTASLKVVNLVEIMKVILDLAQRQIEQSEKIMAKAKGDVRAKLPTIQIVHDVDRMIRALYETYRLSEVGAS